MGIRTHYEVLTMITNERGRQERLVLEGKFDHSPESDQLDNCEKHVILGEEFGEVSRVLSDGIIADKTDMNKLLTELVEVAAVATAWAESLVKAGATREWQKVVPEFKQHMVVQISDRDDSVPDA